MEDTDERSKITRHVFENDHYDAGSPITRCWRKIPKRYIVAFMAFLGFCNVYALRVNLSVAIVAMTKNITFVTKNGTIMLQQDFPWDSSIQGLVLASFFWGYIVTQLPGGWLATKVGGKVLFGGGILSTAVLTLLTPPVARINVFLLMVLRIVQGLFEGVTYPCMHAIWSKWAPPLERSKLSTIAFSGAYFGTVISMPLSGAIGSSLGWEWIFYIFGIIAIIWYIVWTFVVTESPAQYGSITQEELGYIQQAIGYTEAQTKGRSTPWKQVFMSLPMWAICAAHTAENWGFYTMLTELPSYLDQVLHYNLFEAGFAAAVPYLAMSIVVPLGGQLIDFIRSRGYLSTTKTRKLFTCSAFLCQTVFMLITAYVVTPAAAVTCLTLAVGLGGFAWAGFGVNHLDIAPQFASVLMGISNTFATIPGIISPALTGSIVRHGTAREWHVVFYIAAAIYLLGALVYGLLASGEAQEWAQVPMGYQPHLEAVAEEEEEHPQGGDAG